MMMITNGKINKFDDRFAGLFKKRDNKSINAAEQDGGGWLVRLLILHLYCSFLQETTLLDGQEKRLGGSF